MALRDHIGNNIYIGYLKKIYALLDNKKKREANRILALTFINGVSEVIGLAMIIPIIYLINDPDPIYENSILNSIYRFSGISTERNFIFSLILALAIIFVIKNLISAFVYYRQNKFAFSVGTDLIERQLRVHLSYPLLKFREKNSNFIARDVAQIPYELASLIVVPILRITNELFILSLIIIFN